MTLARQAFERRSRLAGSEAISKEDIEQSETSLRKSEAARVQAQKNLEDLVLGTRSEKIDMQRALVASLKESIAAAAVEADRCILRAPYAGSIVERTIHEGMVVQNGSRAFVICEDQSLEAQFGIPPSRIASLKIGESVSLEIRKQSVPATVKSMNSLIDDDTRTLRVVVEIAPGSTISVYPGDIAFLDTSDSESVDWVFGRNAPSFYYNMIGSRQDTPAYAQALVQLRSGRQTVELVRKLQNEANAKFSEARVRILMLEQGPPYAAPIEVRISGFDEPAMRAYGERIRSLLHSYADVVQTTADLTDVYPKLVYSISEEELQRLNLKYGSLSRQLHGSLEGTVGGSIVESNVELPVRVRVKGFTRANSADINQAELLATAADGSRSIVHLASLGTGELKSEPSQITRFNDRPINEVRGYLRAGVLPSTVLRKLKSDLKSAEYIPPPGCSLAFGGESSKRGEAVEQLMSNVSILATGIGFVLVFSLKSFRLHSINEGLSHLRSDRFVSYRSNQIPIGIDRLLC
ncbi:MAG: efflux RND transporter permease subunit [Pirellulales bacterium]